MSRGLGGSWPKGCEFDPGSWQLLGESGSGLSLTLAEIYGLYFGTLFTFLKSSVSSCFTLQNPYSKIFGTHTHLAFFPLWTPVGWMSGRGAAWNLVGAPWLTMVLGSSEHQVCGRKPELSCSEPHHQSCVDEVIISVEVTSPLCDIVTRSIIVTKNGSTLREGLRDTRGSRYTHQHTPLSTVSVSASNLDLSLTDHHGVQADVLVHSTHPRCPASIVFIFTHPRWMLSSRVLFHYGVKGFNLTTSTELTTRVETRVDVVPSWHRHHHHYYQRQVLRSSIAAPTPPPRPPPRLPWTAPPTSLLGGERGCGGGRASPWKPFPDRHLHVVVTLSTTPARLCHLSWRARWNHISVSSFHLKIK